MTAEATTQALATGMRRRLWWPALVVAVVTFSLYLPVGGHDFVNFDDDKFIVDNELIRELSAENVGRIFSSQLFTPHYKPLVQLSWAVEARLFGVDPTFFHLDNVLLHVVNSILVLLLAARLLEAAAWGERVSRWASLLAALLFSLHPLKVEAVAWATARKDVLFGFFFLAALLAYAVYRESSRRRWLVAGTLLFALGILSKSAVVTLPAVLFLVDHLYGWRPARRRLLEKTGFFLVLGVGLWLYGLGGDLSAGGLAGDEAGGVYALDGAATSMGDSARLGGPQSVDAPMFGAGSDESAIQGDAAPPRPPLEAPLPPGAGPLSEIRSSAAGNAHPWLSGAYRYAVYAARLAAPGGLAVLYPVPEHLQTGRHTPLYVAVALAWAALVVLAFFTHRLGFLALGFYSLTLFPGLLAAESGTNFLADRYTYIPSFAYALFIAWLASWSIRLRPALRLPVTVAAIVYLGFLTIATALQITTWRDSRSLWDNVIARGGELPVALNNRGVALKAAGDLAASRRDFERAVDLDPNYFAAISNRAAARRALGDFEGAVADATLALRLRPASAAMYVQRGRALAALGRHLEAIVDFDTAIALGPEPPLFGEADRGGEAYLLRSVSKEKAGDAEGAVTDATRALELGVEPPAPVLLHRAAARLAAGDVSGAVADSGAALTLDPGNASAWNNRGYARFALGDPEGALGDYDQALRLRPDDALAYRNRGDAKMALGRRDEACRDWWYAARIGIAGIAERRAEFCPAP